MVLTRINEFVAKDGCEDAAYTLLNNVSNYIKNCEGSQGCHLYQEVDRPTHFMVIEHWESSDHHKKSLENYPKENMQQAMELFAEPPKGSFYKSKDPS